MSGSEMPSSYAFKGLMTKANGHSIEANEWTTGTLNKGEASHEFLAKEAGVYFYGCAFHIGMGQRGAIVVEN